MAIKKINSSSWLCTVDRKGMKKVRRVFQTKAKAEQFENDYILKNTSVETISLSETVQLWVNANAHKISDEHLNITHAIQSLAVIVKPSDCQAATPKSRNSKTD